MDAKEPQLRSELETAIAQRDSLKKSLSALKDALGNLQVNVKYMQFDLEATRRENKNLRKLIENHDE